MPSAVVPATTGTRPSTWVTTTSSTRSARRRQPRDLARDAERGEAVHAVGDEQIDDAAQAVRIEIARAMNGVGRTEKTLNRALK